MILYVEVNVLLLESTDLRTSYGRDIMMLSVPVLALNHKINCDLNASVIYLESPVSVGGILPVHCW